MLRPMPVAFVAKVWRFDRLVFFIKTAQLARCRVAGPCKRARGRLMAVPQCCPESYHHRAVLQAICCNKPQQNSRTFRRHIPPQLHARFRRQHRRWWTHGVHQKILRI